MKTVWKFVWFNYKFELVIHKSLDGIDACVGTLHVQRYISEGQYTDYPVSTVLRDPCLNDDYKQELTRQINLWIDTLEVSP